jgi:hypothetical protein
MTWTHVVLVVVIQPLPETFTMNYSFSRPGLLTATLISNAHGQYQRADDEGASLFTWTG